MTMKENMVDPALPEKKTTGERQQGPDEIWEYCKGQCGADPWCSKCMMDRERLQEEWLNRKGQTDDKKE